MEDVIPNEGCVITVSHLGFIKRTPVADYRSQKRGGKGVIGAETYEEDFVENLFTASTHDYMLFLTSIGQCHAKKVYDIPEGTRTAKGKSVASFLRLSRGREDRRHALREGLRRGPLSRHGHQGAASSRRARSPTTPTAPARAASSASTSRGRHRHRHRAHHGDNELILVSHQGLAVRFREGRDAETGEDLFRPTGRATGGVTGMRFKLESDYLEVIEVVRPRTPSSSSPARPASASAPASRTTASSTAAAAASGPSTSPRTAPSPRRRAQRQATRRDHAPHRQGPERPHPVNTIRETNRGAKGVKLVTLAEGDKLLSIARVVETDEEQAANGHAALLPDPGGAQAPLPMKNQVPELRAAKGWSQGELAERLGVSRQTINAIETEKYDPSLPLALRIARLFRLPVEKIFSLGDE
jgi:DNA gyrase subunit A